jgi:hypothetical protein
VYSSKHPDLLLPGIIYHLFSIYKVNIITLVSKYKVENDKKSDPRCQGENREK